MAQPCKTEPKQERIVTELYSESGRGKWLLADEILIYKLYKKIGPRFDRMVHYIKGRTMEQIRSRFYIHIRHHIREIKAKHDLEREFQREIQSQHQNPGIFLGHLEKEPNLMLDINTKQPKIWAPAEDEKLNQMYETHKRNPDRFKIIGAELNVKPYQAKARLKAIRTGSIRCYRKPPNPPSTEVLQQLYQKTKSQKPLLQKPSPMPRPKQEEFTSQDDHILMEKFLAFGNAWSQIAKYVGKQPTACKRRYYSHLRKKAKQEYQIGCTKFTPEEDRLLIDCYLKQGPQWDQIKDVFQYRTSGSLQSRYYKLRKNHPELLQAKQEESSLKIGKDPKSSACLKKKQQRQLKLEKAKKRKSKHNYEKGEEEKMNLSSIKQEGRNLAEEINNKLSCIKHIAPREAK